MKCTICKQNLDLSMFTKSKQHKDGYRHQCKICRKKHAAKYYKKNSTIILERNKKWYYNNSNIWKISSRKYRNTIKYKITRSIITSKKKYPYDDGSINYKSLIDLLKKQKHKCNLCKIDLIFGNKNRGMEPSLDHIITYRKGGENKINNVQWLCHSCNSKKHIHNFIF